MISITGRVKLFSPLVVETLSKMRDDKECCETDDNIPLCKFYIQSEQCTRNKNVAVCTGNC